MQILERNTEFHITIPFNNWAKRNLAQVKALSYRRWDPVKKVWIVPINKRIEVLQLAKMCRAEFIKIDTSIAEEVGEENAMFSLLHSLALGVVNYQKWSLNLLK